MPLTASLISIVFRLSHFFSIFLFLVAPAIYLSQLLGIVTVENAVWGIASVYLVVMFYEFSLDKEKDGIRGNCYLIALYA